jgi:hypothetical protein
MRVCSAPGSTLKAAPSSEYCLPEVSPSYTRPPEGFGVESWRFWLLSCPIGALGECLRSSLCSQENEWGKCRSRVTCVQALNELQNLEGFNFLKG